MSCHFTQIYFINFQLIHGAMSCLNSTIALFPKNEIRKPLFPRGKSSFRLFFLCSFIIKTLKLASLFVFWH